MAFSPDNTQDFVNGMIYSIRLFEKAYGVQPGSIYQVTKADESGNVVDDCEKICEQIENRIGELMQISREK